MSQFRPMLACREKPDLEALRYPVMVSPKLDGIRCVIWDGHPLSRTLKLIPNRFVQRELAGLPEGLDGELMLPGKTFNEIQSAIMSVHGEPDFTFNIFDRVPILDEMPEVLGFAQRLRDARFALGSFPRLQLVPHEYATDATGIEMIEERYLTQGYEGVMIRDLDGPYKYGRSTMKEGYLLKLKRFEDAEAVVIGAFERMHNENELTQDALGHAKRSHAQAGKVPAGDLGAFIVRRPDGVEFEIGSGFTAEQRIEYWRQLNAGEIKLETAIVCYKFQPHGTLERPRCPVFKGFRKD